MLAFSEVEIALATNLGVTPANIAKFRARLKQLQRSGWPTGVNTGGKRPDYGAQQLLELALVLELLECGVSPDRAVRLISAWWDSVRRAFLIAGDQADQEIMVGFFQTRFTGLSVRDGHKDIGDIDEGAMIFSITGAETKAELSHLRQFLSAPRYITINLSALRRGLTHGLCVAGIESAFVWAQTEAWRFDLDNLGRSLDPRGN